MKHRTKPKILFFAAALLVAGCSKNPKENAGKTREILPDVAFSTSEGKVTSAELRKGSWLLSFVASWCGPCLVELAEIDSIAKSNKQLKVIALTYEDTSRFRKAIDNLNLTVPLVKVDSTVFWAFGVSKLPTRILISDGVVLARTSGAPTPPDDDFRAALAKALGESTAAAEKRREK